MGARITPSGIRYNDDSPYRAMMAAKQSYHCNTCQKDVLRTNQSEKARPWTGSCSSCIQSKNIKEKSFRNGKPANYSGTKHIPGKLIGNWRRAAEVDRRAFELSNEDLEAIYISQQGLCVLTGLTLQFKGDNLISPDRIDCSKGYVAGNVRFVTKTANYIRRSLSDDQLVYYCSKILETLA